MLCMCCFAIFGVSFLPFPFSFSLVSLVCLFDVFFTGINFVLVNVPSF